MRRAVKISITCACMCLCSDIEVRIELPSVADHEAHPVYPGCLVGGWVNPVVLADISMEVDRIRGKHLIEFDRSRSPCGMI